MFIRGNTCRNWLLFCFFCLPPTLFLYCGISYANDGANSCIVVECFEREWNRLYIKTFFFLQNKTKCLMCVCVHVLFSSFWQWKFCVLQWKLEMVTILSKEWLFYIGTASLESTWHSASCPGENNKCEGIRVGAFLPSEFKRKWPVAWKWLQLSIHSSMIGNQRYLLSV